MNYQKAKAKNSFLWLKHLKEIELNKRFRDVLIQDRINFEIRCLIGGHYES